MKWKHYSLLVIAIAAIAYSCAPSMKVTSDYDKTTNFTQYKTFAVELDPAKSPVSQINQTRIVNAVKGELIKKGLKEDAANPDLLVNVATILKDRASVSSNTNYYGYGGAYRPYGWGGGLGVTGYTTYDVQHYKDGSLIIGISDAKKKQLLWEGIGNSEIDKPLDNPDQQVPAAIAKILATYPPGAVTKN